MNLRYIVPALGLAALTSTSFAEDKAPAVTFGGFVDTVLQYTDDDQKNDNAGVTDKDESKGSLRFTGEASLKANWKVTDALSAHINLWLDPGANAVNMREAYFTWGFNDSLSWSMGKYIDHIGWISAEPTGPTFLFINADTIGYRQIYGNDVLGTALGIAPKGSPISGSIHITNGYFTGTDASSVNYASPASGNRENTDLGLGLDVTFNLPNDMGNINAELAYDMHSGNTTYLGGVNPTGLGGDALLVGVNATVKPVKILTLGGEFQYFTLGEFENQAGVKQTDTGMSRTQGLLLANVVIEGSKIPMSVSGLFQYVGISRDAAATPETESRIYIGGALLTNPLTSANFGLNFEVGYFDETSVGGIKNADVSGVTVAVEGLVSF